jgi:hypothetical protein
MNGTRANKGKLRFETHGTTRRSLLKTGKGMSLSELRQVRKLSQRDLAVSMNKKQPNLSKMERNSDMYVSTLRMFVEAMGGNLEIIAQFPDGDVRIDQFRE